MRREGEAESEAGNLEGSKEDNRDLLETLEELCGEGSAISAVLRSR